LSQIDGSEASDEQEFKVKITAVKVAHEVNLFLM
jgi:hypothetical protein